MMKKNGLMLALTLVIGIALGIASTGLVFANSTGRFQFPMSNAHMSHHSMAEGCDLAENMIEDCPDYQAHHGGAGGSINSHHNSMHP